MHALWHRITGRGGGEDMPRAHTTDRPTGPMGEKKERKIQRNSAGVHGAHPHRRHLSLLLTGTYASRPPLVLAPVLMAADLLDSSSECGPCYPLQKRGQWYINEAANK